MPYKDKEKQLKYQNEWAKRRRIAWLKENGPCVKCGSWDELQVDHKDASKKVTHRVWTWSEKRRQDELASCQVLCAECHKEKSSKEKARGTRQGKSIFSEADVLRIRQLASEGMTQVEIAKEFSSNRKTIHDIVKRRSWDWL